MKGIIDSSLAINEKNFSEPVIKSMNIVFFTHPEFVGHVSLPRFSRMLIEGMRDRGHSVEIWSPKPRFFKLPAFKGLKKWLGYIDQYIIFPLEVRIFLKDCHSNTLFVFTDNALGPWVSLVVNRPHVIHCHDFMAQESALGLVPENPTSWTGKQYQKLIFRGYSKGRNFISGSNNTKRLLHRFLTHPPIRSEIVYNGLNQIFKVNDVSVARLTVGKEIGVDVTSGYLLHVGGNQWYKNRIGVVKMYEAWRSISTLRLPLLLIGLAPDTALSRICLNSPCKGDIHFIINAKDSIVRLAYSGASVFLFPSKAEGFGWPIAEAMASGCPVITTDDAPMTEVAGNAGFLIPKCPHDPTQSESWALEAGEVINRVIHLSPSERQRVVAEGLENAQRFATEPALNQVERIYSSILDLKEE